MATYSYTSHKIFRSRTAIQAEEFKQGVFWVFSGDSRADSAYEPMDHNHHIVPKTVHGIS